MDEVQVIHNACGKEAGACVLISSSNISVLFGQQPRGSRRRVHGREDS